MHSLLLCTLILVKFYAANCQNAEETTPTTAVSSSSPSTSSTVENTVPTSASAPELVVVQPAIQDLGDDCITCYSCNSYSDPACRQKDVIEMHQQNFTTQCCGIKKGCRFTLQIVEKYTRVIRQCAFAGESGCVLTSGEDSKGNFYGETCACAGNLCNGGLVRDVSTVTMILLITTTILV